MKRKNALITGISRKINIGAAIGRSLAKEGWDIAFTYWLPYDDEMPWKSHPEDIVNLISEYESYGAKVFAMEADLSDEDSVIDLYNHIEKSLGSVTALVLSHCYSVDLSITSATVDLFDRHFDVNAKGSWLMMKYFEAQYDAPFGDGRIVALTSDHVAYNMPNGASKGALDRIVIAAANEFRDKGITCNVINPGAVDTGWMDDDIRAYILRSTYLKRLGKPEDCANLVSFLCSEKGGWINGQLLYSDGGVNYTG